jgi:outer membrane receptor protein involved in Fe transport
MQSKRAATGRKMAGQTLVATALVLAGFAAAAAETVAPVESLVVTAARTPVPELDTVGNIAALSEEDILVTAAIHPHELGVRVPGVWIGRGSGQEHLTAIRSPVLTGPGSCGAFLVMEDGIPTRPAGFCNVNQLFEVPLEMAASVEVIRGPANALYGSNALHGTVNTLLPTPGGSELADLRVMAGSNDYWRGIFNWDSGPAPNAFNAGLLLETNDGYRDDSGNEQAKFYGKSRHELAAGELSFALSASWLDQDTAGYIQPDEDGYKDRDTRYRNDNPEAYREATSLRLSSTWVPDDYDTWQPEYRFFLRNSEMEFLQHFIPSQPTEKNGQTSGGLMVIARRDWWRDSTLTLGIDTGIAQGYLDEYQENPPPGFAQNRPIGQHYDYDVDSYLAAGFASLSLPLGERWELQAGLRGEYMRYKYDNKMLDGNSTDTGGQCTDPDNKLPPDGCLYFRPADRSDDFFNLSPNLGVLYKFTEATVGFANLTSGFRTPQAAELYRLQAQQEIADIESERIDSIELGTRHQAQSLSLEAVAFYMYKSNFIFTDSAGINVSDGKTRHYGIEANVLWRIIEPVYLSFVGSYAIHEYDFDQKNAGLGEVISKGNEVDTAPQILASARLGYENRFGLAELEWVHNGPYYLDAANTARYAGHDLLNLRLLFNITPALTFAIRVNNLTDAVYADRADLLSSVTPPRYRYFPGPERQAFLELSWAIPNTSR